LRGHSLEIITFIGLAASREEKAELPLQFENGIPHNHVDMPPFVSTEATWVCIYQLVVVKWYFR
jgi:hypothetical protein